MRLHDVSHVVTDTAVPVEVAGMGTFPVRAFVVAP